MVTQIVRPPTLTVTVQDAIRDAIFQGDFAPGSPLRESDLCESLGVSRSTVREALLGLQEEGLVEIVPHRGALVRRLSPRTAQEVYTLRSLIEPYAVRVALENRGYGEECLKNLEALVRRMGTREVEGDISGLIKDDAEFHYLMCKQSDHQLLLKVLESIQSLMILFMLHTKLYRSDLVSEEHSHGAVLEAIRQGNPAHAEEMVRKHINDAGTSLLSRMEEVDWDSINVSPA